MPLEGEYEPSTQAWVREQVERYAATGGRDAGYQQRTDRENPVFLVDRRPRVEAPGERRTVGG